MNEAEKKLVIRRLIVVTVNLFQFWYILLRGIYIYIYIYIYLRFVQTACFNFIFSVLLMILTKNVISGK